jgi:hypothetical protein
MKYLLLLLLPLTVISCQKGLPDETANTPGDAIDCYQLKEGLFSNNISMINESLGTLLNREYSNENLEQLSAIISASCYFTDSLECFDCIKTDPPQSEMLWSFRQINREPAQFIADLGPATDGTIKIVSIEQ